MKGVCALSIVLVAGAALAAAPREPAADEKAVRAVLEKQVEDWNRGDLDGFLATYWNSPDLVFQSGATRTQGWAATRERYRLRYQAEGKEMGRLRFDELDVQMLAPDAAFARGRWHLVMKDGSEPHGLFTLLLRRLGGRWQIVHDHTS